MSFSISPYTSSILRWRFRGSEGNRYPTPALPAGTLETVFRLPKYLLSLRVRIPGPTLAGRFQKDLTGAIWDIQALLCGRPTVSEASTESSI